MSFSESLTSTRPCRKFSRVVRVNSYVYCPMSGPSDGPFGSGYRSRYGLTTGLMGPVRAAAVGTAAITVVPKSS